METHLLPQHLDRTRHQMLGFDQYVFTWTFEGMMEREAQRAKAKYLGFVETTAGRNKPGNRSTSLKTQQDGDRALL